MTQEITTRTLKDGSLIVVYNRTAAGVHFRLDGSTSTIGGFGPRNIEPEKLESSIQSALDELEAWDDPDTGYEDEP